MEKINLKEILAKHNLYPNAAAFLFIRDGKEGSSLDRQLAALKEVWNLAVEKCKESAKAYTRSNGEWVSSHTAATVDKESIEQVKQLIL